MEKVAASIFLLILTGFSFTHKEPDLKNVNWISFQELEKKLETKDLPVIIDVYTDWCGWCKVMDQKTYGKSKVFNYLNQKFYAVKFNAESKEDVPWRGKIYRYDHNRGIHSLALELIKRDMGFPNTVFVANKSSVPESFAGYMAPKEFQIYLTYYGDEKNRSTDFETYARNFRPSW